MSTRGKIVVIVAPSGTGKLTLLKKLMDEVPSLQWSVSCTTRPKRTGEEEGIDYFYITTKDFENRIENNEFVEYAKVHSNYYGTSKAFIENGLKYNTSTQPTVELSYNETPENHHIIIKDNGIGIEEKYFDKIFVMFQRLHNFSVNLVGFPRVVYF